MASLTAARGLRLRLPRQALPLANCSAGPKQVQARCFSGAPPITITDPLPPPEFEADGAPRRYPLHQAIHEHGYTYETWQLKKEGVFHTSYEAELAADLGPQHAWRFSFPLWVRVPAFFMVGTFVIYLTQLGGNLGIKPKRYTPEWVMATKERERIENTNPVTRYLDRRVAERGTRFPVHEFLPQHLYFLWMYNSHDHDYREERGLPDLRG